MSKLGVFNHITLDGFFTDPKNDMSFAHAGKPDPEWDEFVAKNAGGGGRLVFGRVTWQMMASYWPTPAAAQAMPVVAERMNNLPKIVFSRSLEKAEWNNTRLIKGDLVAEMSKLKAESAPDMVILGSGSLVAQLAKARLIDEYNLVINPVILGAGRTLFAGLQEKLQLKLEKSRTFKNGNVLATYVAA